MNKKQRKEQRAQGITLVALIITIIVLLILAVVTIREITGNGIVAHAQNASKQWNIENEREAIALSSLAYQMADGKQPKLGIELYNKDLYNGERWDMVFTDEENYGTGWNYIEKGTEVADYGKTMYNWVINYTTGETVYLEEKKYDKLDYTESVAITGDELVMNIDATNLSDENSWENVNNHGKNADGTGGVTYDAESMALIFDGVDDYLELTKPGNFSNGFTFEIYMNLERGGQFGALFCKKTKGSVSTNSMRFGFQNDNFISKFYEPKSKTTYDGNNSYTKKDGAVFFTGVNINDYLKKDAYVTYVYYRNKVKEQYSFPEEILNYMNNNTNCDVLALYIDGELKGYSGYTAAVYDEGRTIWDPENTDINIPLFIGLCPWSGNNYYLQGKVYSTRLYTRPLDETEVADNVETTLSYREALKKLEQ